MIAGAVLGVCLVLMRLQTVADLRHCGTELLLYLQDECRSKTTVDLQTVDPKESSRPHLDRLETYAAEKIAPDRYRITFSVGGLGPSSGSFELNCRSATD